MDSLGNGWRKHLDKGWEATKNDHTWKTLMKWNMGGRQLKSTRLRMQKEKVEKAAEQRQKRQCDRDHKTKKDDNKQKDKKVRWADEEANFRDEKTCKGAKRVEWVYDNEMLTSWVNGQSAVNDDRINARIGSMQMEMYEMWKVGLITTLKQGGEWCRHVRRELNKRADAMATKGKEEQKMRKEWLMDANMAKAELQRPSNSIRCYSDGGYSRGKMGMGIYITILDDKACEHAMLQMSWGSKVECKDNNNMDAANSMVAEINAAVGALKAIKQMMGYVKGKEKTIWCED